MTKFDKWRRAYEAYLIGETFNPGTPDGRRIVSSVERVAEDSLNRPEILAVELGPGIRIRSLAAAFRTPGSRYYGKEDTLKEILHLLDGMEETYNLQTPPDNWWLVEVGNPLRILDTLILLYDFLEERDGLIARWTEVILHFQDAYGRSSHGAAETGANMMWKCHVHILTGILRKDQALIDWAKGQLPGLLRYSRKISHPKAGTFYDDGFYPDGSFIQHHFFAYTGGYGKHFLNILSGLLYAFRNTDMELLDRRSVEFLCEMVEKAYAPLIVDGRFMDIARGREPSRFNYQDNICARHVMRSLCYLSEAVPPKQGDGIRALLKLWLSKGDNREELCVDEDAWAEYYVYPSLGEVLERLDRDGTAGLKEQRGHYNFGPMCKTVHRHGSWSAAVSMYSRTTACYEYLNGESEKFWHMGDGVTYLYTADADQYNGDFYATVDMQRLPGTTVDRSPEREGDPYYSWFLPESKNVYGFAGGAALDGYGIAGMQYRGQGRGKERNLEVKKSWFFLGEEIICLGSGISSGTGDPVETTVLNQRLEEAGKRILTIDGKAYDCSGTEERTAVGTLHLTGNRGRGSDIGVVFPGQEEVHVLCQHRKGTWNRVELLPGYVKENDFATVWISHGTCPEDAAYAYILLPGRSAEETERYAGNPEAEILECTGTVHAVRSRTTGMTGCNFWKEAPASCAGISVDTQASVILQKGGGELRLTVSDPTKGDCAITVRLDCSVSEVTAKSEGIQILAMSPLTILADTKGQEGQSLILIAKQ